MDNFLDGWKEFMKSKHELNVISYKHVYNEIYGTYLFLDDDNIIGMNFEAGYPYDVADYDLLSNDKTKIKTLGSTLV
ncbi:hypothetical protein KQI61_05915 [Anaerocolumna aminovalerica]|uniref:hypothetical protein n=1 Tax=Anaerocolumna aminovalerica TaxID=1527 RepID=UPI001C0F3654|nr:hypothetical protein [Anaerocolumna aminovalerica]MBU5331726.1 hypothetical protein [Anaerocolumna aminovalerica]